MELKIGKLPKHDYRCIIVPSEKLDKPVSDYKVIVSDEKKYKIIDKVTIFKSEPIPTSLLLLSIGQDIPKEMIYAKYKNSDRLIFFICDEETPTK